MKKFKKSTAIVLSICLFVVMAIGFLFCYIPFNLKDSKYVSMLGKLNVSSDLSGGFYVEYDITTENPSQQDLTDSMKIVKEVFEDEGYSNVNAYVVGSKFRVEVSYPEKTKSFTDVYTGLTGIASGAFVLSSAQDLTSDGAINVYGKDCVKSVVVSTNDSSKMITINFNDYGKAQYEALLNKTRSVYIHLGTYNQSLDLSSASTFDSLSLSDSDYSNLLQLEQKINFGCLKISLNDSSFTVNTMGATMSYGFSNASSPEEEGFFTSKALVVFEAAVAGIAVLIIAIFVAKFGLFGLIIAISMLANSYLFLILACLMPSFEIGYSVFVALGLIIPLIYTFTYMYASKVKSEYELGKSLNASLESGYKKTFANLLFSNISLFISALIIFAFSFGELTTASIVFAIGIFLSAFTNLVFVPFLVKLFISFDKLTYKVFMLKKRKISFDKSQNTEEEAE